MTTDVAVATHDEIARRAYHLYETDGRDDGYDIEHWLLAEQELTHNYVAGDWPRGERRRRSAKTG